MNQDFDVIIVGSGPRGLTIGGLLAREGISSLIVEKALALRGRYRSVDSQYLYLDEENATECNCWHWVDATTTLPLAAIGSLPEGRLPVIRRCTKATTSRSDHRDFMGQL